MRDFAIASVVTLLFFSTLSFSATKPVKPVRKAAVSSPSEKEAAVHSSDSASREGEAPKLEGDQTREKSEPAEPTTAADFKKLGDQYRKKGQKDKALESYRKCIEISGEDTGFGKVALLLGEESFRLKEYEEALHYFRKVSGKESTQIDFRMMLGEALQAVGKNDSAIFLLEPLAKNQKIKLSSRVNLFRILGDAYLKRDSTDRAVAWYSTYLKTGGKQNADMAYLIAVSEEKTNAAKAKLKYEANIRNYPGDHRNYTKLAGIQAKNKGTRQSALGLLKKAASLNDSAPSVWMEIGKISGELGKKEEQVDAYRNCLRVDPDNLEAKIRMGTLLLEHGASEEAFSLLESAHKQAPDSVAPMVALAAGYSQAGKNKKAIEMLQNIKKVQPKNMEIRKQLISAYQIAGDDKQALEELQAALEVERDFELLIPYAKLLLKNGRAEEAEAPVEEMLGMMPDNIDALMTKALILRKTGKLEEAGEVYKEVGMYDAKYAPALYERAEVSLEMEKVKWAEMFYQRALAADPKFALAEVGLAKISALYNDRSATLTHLDNAAALAPNDPEVQKAIEMVRNPRKKESSMQTATSRENGGEDASSGAAGGEGKKSKKKRRK